MLDWLFMIFLVLAIILLFMAIEFQDSFFWCGIFIITDIILWFILAASVMMIEIPYQMYNATSGLIETGYHTFSSPVSPWISYLFQFFGVIMVFYFLGFIFIPAIKMKFGRRY